jgi:predicted 3-demethylubiquinone-9 3-methyltransferase (glyoxalase superfamily)
MAQKTTTFLMFEGKAEEAVNFYIPLFPNSAITKIIRYGKEGPGQEGKVLKVDFTLAGQEYMAIDSAVHHEFTFTPAMSIFVDCENEEEILRLHTAFKEGGQELMGLADYGFSKKFAWLNDRFGVSWQLNLP